MSSTSPTSITRLASALTLMALEVHCSTRGDKMPDPIHDAVLCVTYCMTGVGTQVVMGLSSVHGHNDNDDDGDDDEDDDTLTIRGAIFVNPSMKENVPIPPHPLRQGSGNRHETFVLHTPDVVEFEVPSELILLQLLLYVVNKSDPDVMVGWEVQKGSWGYLEDRYAVLRQQWLDRSFPKQQGRPSGPAPPPIPIPSPTTGITTDALFTTFRTLSDALSRLRPLPIPLPLTKQGMPVPATTSYGKDQKGAKVCLSSLLVCLIWSSVCWGTCWCCFYFINDINDVFLIVCVF